MAALKVLIYGSCVSRDILRITGERFDLQHYIARQSLVSAFSPPLDAPDVSALTGFKNRSLRGDFESNAPALISEHAPASDLLLFDITTDRRGVYPSVGGSMLSHTAELAESGLLDEFRRGPLIRLGDAEHVALFRSALEQLKDLLVSVDAFEKAVFLRFDHAAKTDSGVAIPHLQGRGAVEWDAIYEQYYELIESGGFRILPLPSELSVSSDSHSWGPGQIHFVDDAYLWWADRLEEIVLPTTHRLL